MDKLEMLVKYGTSERQYYERLLNFLPDERVLFGDEVWHDTDLSWVVCPYCGRQTIENLAHADSSSFQKIVNGEWDSPELYDTELTQDTVYCSNSECEFEVGSWDELGKDLEKWVEENEDDPLVSKPTENKE